ncbi:MAG: glycosyl hydrolase family 28-related protein [Phycisphaerales bacterium]
MTKTTLNVKLFGAKGDGVTDDTQAFLNLLKSVPNDTSPPDPHPRNAGPVMFIPEGVYVISQTLEIKKFIGLEIRGSGASFAENVVAGSPFGPRTVLLWKGNDSSPMFLLEDIQGMTISDMTLFGRESSEDDRCQALIQFKTSSVSSMPTFNNTIRNVAFWEAVVGIQCGTENENGNACMYYEMVTFKNCNTGFQVNNSQSVNHLFNDLFASGCEIILDLKKGGSVNVQTMGCTDCGYAIGKYAIEFREGGPNVGPSVITAFRYENVSRLLRVTGNHRLICDGLGQSAGAPAVGVDDDPLIYLSGGGTVFINGRWQFTQAIGAPTILGFRAPGTGNYCTVSFERSQFPFNEFAGEPPAFPVTSVIQNPNQANCAWDFRRCDGPAHKPLPDATSGDWD